MFFGSNKKTVISTDFDSAGFWTKFVFPVSSKAQKGESGLMKSVLFAYGNDYISLLCKRPYGKSFIKRLTLRPFPENTSLALAFQNENVFELWSAQINRFLGFRDGADEYELKNLKLEKSHSARKKERFIIPNMSTTLRGISNEAISDSLFVFSGCEVSEIGVCLWFPASVDIEDKVRPGELYKITFFPKMVEPFSFTVKCIRGHYADNFSKGFLAGFMILEDANVEERVASKSKLRLKQMIEAKGRSLNTEFISIDGENEMAKFWEGELKSR